MTPKSKDTELKKIDFSAPLPPMAQDTFERVQLVGLTPFS